MIVHVRKKEKVDVMSLANLVQEHDVSLEDGRMLI